MCGDRSQERATDVETGVRTDTVVLDQIAASPHSVDRARRGPQAQGEGPQGDQMGPSPHRFSGPLGLSSLRTDAPTVTATTRTRSRALAARGDAVSHKRRCPRGREGHEPERARHRSPLENDENESLRFSIYLRFVSFANTCADTRDIDSTQTRSRTDAGRYTDHGRLKTKDALSQCGGASAGAHTYTSRSRRCNAVRLAGVAPQHAPRQRGAGPKRARAWGARDRRTDTAHIDTRASRAAGVSHRAHRPLRRTEGHRASG